LEHGGKGVGRFLYEEMYFTDWMLSRNQRCGSGMCIPEPDFYPSQIPDPGSKNSNKREGRKKIGCHTFFCSLKFYQIEMLKEKKIWPNLIFKEL
jgi:hypothetical protein